MEVLLLILALVVFVAGIGLILLQRARAGRAGAAGPVTTEAPPTPPPRAAAPAPDVAAPDAGLATAEPETIPAVEGPPAEDLPLVVEDLVVDEVVIEEGPGGELTVEELVVAEELVVDQELLDRELAELLAPERVKPRFRDRLGKARTLFGKYLGAVRSRATITEETWEDLEEALIRADVGVGLTTELLDELRATAKREAIKDPEVLLGALKAELIARLGGLDRSLRLDAGVTNVWLFVGVNGVGKTTTIGKVGQHQRAEGRSVVMAAGDTFRAAAAEQLTTWAERVGADIVRGNEGGDPSAVVFDAVQRAAARGVPLVLADTAGRLHTKTNLMEELRKVRRVADREPGHVTEVLLVLDATTGQNGLVQARQFTDAVEVTGVVLTKLDGSAKGGIVLAIQSELGIPVKLVGLGETADDLVEFDPDEFVDALFAA